MFFFFGCDVDFHQSSTIKTRTPPACCSAPNPGLWRLQQYRCKIKRKVFLGQTLPPRPGAAAVQFNSEANRLVKVVARFCTVGTQKGEMMIPKAKTVRREDFHFLPIACHCSCSKQRWKIAHQTHSHWEGGFAVRVTATNRNVSKK